MEFGLSPRLEAVASQVLMDLPMADIGTDHALLPEALVRTGTVPNAVAMDVASGPLQMAKSTVTGMEHLVQIRQSDGLDALVAGEVATICMCGMGGVKMAGILERGREIWMTAERLVLQPQGMPQRVREVMLDAGWDTVLAVLVEDRKKLFTVEAWESKGAISTWDALDLRWGRLIRSENTSLFGVALRRELGQVEQALHQMRPLVSKNHPDVQRLLRDQFAIKNELQRCGYQPPSG